MKPKNSILLVFKFLCMFVTALTIGYLIAKFLEHEDVIVIDYMSIDTYKDTSFTHPELSICFEYGLIRNDPFNVTNGKSHPGYIQFELNLADYVNDTLLYFQNDPDHNLTCTDLQDCYYFNFTNQNNEMIGRSFSKCFTFEVHINVSSLFIHFNANWTNVLDKFSRVFVTFNQPNKFIRPPYGRLYLNSWTKNLEKNEKIVSDIFQIQYINFTRRRGNPKSPCSNIPRQFDYSFANNSSQNGSKNDKKSPVVDLKEIGRILEKEFLDLLTDYPCHEMFKIDYRHSRWFQSERNLSQPIKNESLTKNTQQYTLRVHYPLFIKVEKEEKKFDELDLFGAIGGYIGLFWGIS